MQEHKKSRCLHCGEMTLGPYDLSCPNPLCRGSRDVYPCTDCCNRNPDQPKTHISIHVAQCDCGFKRPSDYSIALENGKAAAAEALKSPPQVRVKPKRHRYPERERKKRVLG